VPAALTPADTDGRFLAPPFERLLARLFAARVDGIYVLGYSGEGFQQPVPQRQAIAEAAVALTPPGRSAIVHVGGGSVADAVMLARHAARVGAHAIASLPPSGADRPADEQAYFARLADASGLPVLLYYLPGVCGRRSLARLLDICAVPGVAGLKFSDTDVYAISVLARRGHVVFNGTDEVLAAGILMGATGGVGGFYNLVPEAFVALHDAARAGDWTRAREEQAKLNALIEAVLPFPLIPAFKALSRMGGIDCGSVFAPRRDLDAAHLEALRAAVAATDLGRDLLTRQP
jgi:N-acetylneuraminate lyase